MKSKSVVSVAFGIIVAAVFSAQNTLSQANTTNPRSASNPRISGHAEGYTRFVLELPRAVKYTPLPNGRSLTVTIGGLKPTELRLGGTPRTVDTNELIDWSLEPKGTGSLLTLKSTFTLNKTRGFKVFTLPPDGNAPHRLVVDLGPNIGANASPTSSRPASPGVPPARTPQRPDPIVVIDPGHGGIDSGMVGYVVEKQVTLDIGLKLRGLLMAKGVRVQMTRVTDRAWQRDGSIKEKQRDLDARAQMASVERNVFVSIHVNSASSADARGAETFVFGEPLEERTLRQAERENGGGDIGRALTRQLREASSNVINRQLIQENLKFSRMLAQAVQSNLVARTGAYNRGIDQAYFWVIRYSRIPAILVETGFGTNPTEGKNLATNAYRLKVAQGIADGILKFLRRE